MEVEIEINERQRELMKLINFFERFAPCRRITLTTLYYKTDYTYRTVKKEILDLEEKKLVKIDKFRKRRKRVKTNSWSISLTEMGLQLLEKEIRNL